MENKIRGMDEPNSKREEQTKPDLNEFSQDEIEEALQSALKDLYTTERAGETTGKGYRYGGRSGKQSSKSRSRSPTRSRASGPDQADGTVIRSPMYRSASPSRRKRQDGVIMTSWSQAPRFKDEKTWIPGKRMAIIVIATLANLTSVFFFGSFFGGG